MVKVCLSFLQECSDFMTYSCPPWRSSLVLSMCRALTLHFGPGNFVHIPIGHTGKNLKHICLNVADHLPCPTRVPNSFLIGNLFLSESNISREEVNQVLIVSPRFRKKCLVTLQVCMTEMQRWWQHPIFRWLLFTQVPADAWVWCIGTYTKLKADR